MKTFDIDDPGLEFIQEIRRCGAFVYREDISEGEKKMKTFDKKDVFTLVTAEEAKDYIWKQGYFGDSFGELEEEIKKNSSKKLAEIFFDQNTDINIVFRPQSYERAYGLFLPADKVKEVEEPKKWRAFKDIDEFVDTLDIELGQSIMLRNKYTPRERVVVVFTGYRKFDNELSYIMLGSLECSTATLYNSYEIFNDSTKTWQPFGVLDES